MTYATAIALFLLLSTTTVHCGGGYFGGYGKGGLGYKGGYAGAYGASGPIPIGLGNKGGYAGSYGSGQGLGNPGASSELLGLGGAGLAFLGLPFLAGCGAGPSFGPGFIG